MTRCALKVQGRGREADPRVATSLDRPNAPAPPRIQMTPPDTRNPQLASPDGAAPHFAVLGIPVRIGLGFWLVAVLFGFNQKRTLIENVRAALVLAAIFFVSILVHELGHALVARRYGARPSILLHAFGGLTTYAAEGLVMTRGRRILISLAGPFAGFVLGGLTWVVASRFHLTPGAKLFVERMLWVNVGWGIINLLPILPLDGGNVLAAALGPKRVFATAIVSAVFALAMAGFGFWLGNVFMVVLFGFAGINAIGQARSARAGDVDRRDGLEEQLRRAKAALDRGDFDDAYLLADDVVRRARTQPVRNGGYTALAWVHVARGEGVAAREALAHVEPRFAVDPYTLAAVEDAAGAPERARALLEEARRRGYRSVPSSKLHIDLLARDGRIEEAVDVAHEDADILSPSDVRAVYGAALEAGVARGAARLASRLFELHAKPEDALDEARALVKAGDVAGALAAIAHAIQIGPVDRDAVRTDPAFETLAGDERFERILTA